MGAFTFAIIPGQTYNLLRAAALKGTVAFNALTLRTVPSSFANYDGSISYEALAKIGFRYRGLDPAQAAAVPITAPILCSIDLDGAVKSFVAGLAGAVQGLSNLIARGIGTVAGLFKGNTNVGVRVRLLNIDPSFNTARPEAVAARTVAPDNGGPLRDEEVIPTPMVQAWGADSGFPLQLRGTRIRAHGLSIPSFDESTMDSVSHASVNFVVNNATGLCILLENDAADVIDLITSVEICDFRRFSIRSATTAIPFELSVAHDTTNVFAQLTDGANFSQAVAKYKPRQVHTLVGPYADFMPKAITPASIFQTWEPWLHNHSLLQWRGWHP